MRQSDYTAHGMRIRARRLRKGWRQVDLAKRAGLQPGSVSRIEVGFHNPQLGTLGRIASALGCSIDDLVAWHVDLDGEASM
jgi:transcriptional regulator with XRE-family HTH domain